MEIRQFRLIVRARNFAASSRFYGDVLSLPRLESWEREDGRGALFHAGTGVIELRGRPAGAESGERDEHFDFQAPEQKMTISLIVPSAEEAYRLLILRDKNLPGGLQRGADGALSFVTRDPDGVRIAFREAAP